MKRIIYVMLIPLFLFCSCNEKMSESSVSMNPDSLNTAFSLKLKDVIYSGNIKLNDDNSLNIALNFPEEVDGISFVINDDDFTTTFEETVIQRTSSSENVFSRLYDALKTLRTEIHYTEITDGYEYKTDSFKAILDNKCNLKWIKMNDAEFYFR